MHKILAYGLIIDIIIFDQLSKWAVTEYMIRGGESALNLIHWLSHAPERLDFKSISVMPFFNIVMVWNEGVSFGLFNNDGINAAIPLIIISLIVCAIFLVWLARTSYTLQAYGIALVIGGAIGNVIDRIRFGAVIDFLDFHIAGYHWPAFNIADSAIVIGVLILIVHTFLYEGKTDASALDKIEPGD